jgi:hypothetical protein
MRFVAICLLLFSFVALLDSACFAKTEVQVTNLSYAAAGTDDTADADAEACGRGRGCRMKARAAACGSFVRRTSRACRSWRLARGRCSSCS